MKLILLWALAAVAANQAVAFSIAGHGRLAGATVMQMSSATSDSSETVTDEAPTLLKRERYVATNRFAVRKGKEAQFEKRWATRKSRLATLDGFKYFHLMRRINLEDGTYDSGSNENMLGNYVSFTIWNKKSNFSAWRKGEAFKEAHGGTSIGAFVSTLVSSALVLKGAPRPAFYDGLLQQSMAAEDVPTLVDGWRNVQADGSTVLPAECFVACNQFFVPNKNRAAFEDRWANRSSQLKECDGFISFSMLRRDGSAKGHGIVEMQDNEPTYQSTTIWKDRASFEKWKSGSAFQKAHGDQNKETASPPKPLWSKPPVPVFYEGTLVIATKDGC